MFTLMPPGSAIVCRRVVRLVERRVRVVTRRRTVFVRERRTAGFAALRLRAVVPVRRPAALRVFVVRRVAAIGGSCFGCGNPTRPADEAEP